MKPSSDQIVREYLEQLVEEQLDSQPEEDSTRGNLDSNSPDGQVDLELLAHLAQVDNWAQRIDGLWPEQASENATRMALEQVPDEISEELSTVKPSEKHARPAPIAAPLTQITSAQSSESSTPAWAAEDLISAEQLGRFKIIRPLGSGGMGNVLLAYDPIMQREVALKIPHPGMLINPTARKRFLREARAAGLLNHPRVITIYEAGEIGSICYIAAEFDPGITLAAWLSGQSGSIPFRQAAEIVWHLAETVEHAHQRGVIHRDLKPANVMMNSVGVDFVGVDFVGSGTHGNESNGEEESHSQTSTQDHSSYPRIIDFGLAHLADEQLTLTQSGSQLGTAAYMAPEQVYGQKEKISPATDIFSLGVLLFEILTRVSPFQREGVPQTLDAITKDEPRLASHRPEISRDLDAICMRALAKTPARRYQSAHELAEDLQRFLCGKPVMARPVGSLVRGAHWCQRHPAAAALIGVSVVATVLLISLSLFHARDMASVNRGLASSLTESEKLRKLATSAATVAQQKTDLLQRHLYVADINLAYRAWEEQDLRKYENLLIRHQPSGDNGPPGIEWRFLWRLGHPQVRTIDQTSTHLYSICSSPTGETFGVAAADGMVRIYDAKNFTLIDQFATGQGEVNSVSFSSDGELLASAGDDGSVKIWNWQDQIERLSIQAHNDLAFGSIFLADHKTIATWGREPQIRLWNLETGKLYKELRGHSHAVQNVQLSPNGTQLASASDDRTVILWNLDEFKQHVTFKIPERASLVVFSPDGNKIFIGMVNGDLQGWDIKTEKCIFSTKALDDIHSLAISPSGNKLAFGDFEGLVHVFDLINETEIAISKIHTDRVYALQFTPEGNQLISAGRDGKLKTWAFQQASWRRIVRGLHVPRLVATDNQLLVGMGKTGVHLIDPFTGNAIQALEGSEDWIRPCGSADGKTLVAHSLSNEVRVWDLPSRTLIHRWQLAQPVESLAISADGRLAAVVTSNLEQNLFTIYEMKTGTITREFRQPSGVARAAISPNGEYFALTLNDTFSLWNLKSDSRRGPFQGPFGSISEIDFSPDGRVLAIASGNRTIQLWDVASASWIASLEGHRHAVRGVQFLANGKTIMSWDITGFGFWDVETGQQFYIHQIGKSPHDIFTTSAQRFKKLYSLVISPDQSWLASSGMGISTSILDLSMDE